MSLEALKDKIKNIPISSLVAHYLPLQKKGATFVTLCPFHNDSNPSLTINDSKNMYKCWSCNAGGDIFTFVQDYRHVDFIEALKELASVAGLPFDDYVEKKPRSPKEEMKSKILLKASQLFGKYAEKMPPEFKSFIEARSLRPETWKKFSLGFAPSGNVLLSYLDTIKTDEERNLALSVAQELGLIREKNGRHFDFFQNRIMFPIHNSFGQLVGFTGRATLPEQKPKYMNSSESDTFKKSNILYAHHLAKSAIRGEDRVLIVEGNMDAIALHQANVLSTVAVMGVALSEQSVISLKNLTSNIYLALDSDGAGIKAMEKSDLLLLRHGVIAKAISFAPHKDADEFIRAEGIISLQKRIDEAVAHIDLRIDRLIESGVPQTTDAKLQILQKLFQILGPLKESLQATERLFSFAQRLGLRSDTKQLLSDYQKSLTQNGGPHPQPPKVIRQEANKEDEQRLASHVTEEKISVISKIEGKLLSEMLQHPELLSHRALFELLDFVRTHEVKEYIARLKGLYMEIEPHEYQNMALSLAQKISLTKEFVNIVGSALFEYRPSELNEKVQDRLLFDFKRKLMEENVRQQKLILKEKQKECVLSSEIESVLREISELDKKLTEIRNQKPPR